MQQCIFFPTRLWDASTMRTNCIWLQDLRTGWYEMSFSKQKLDFPMQQKFLWMTSWDWRTWHSSGNASVARHGSNPTLSLANFGSNQHWKFVVIGLNLSKQFVCKFHPVKDACTNLSRVIPLRLYGDGCEATRILSAVWCATHVQNHHV